MNTDKIENNIRNIPDFPKKGIQFKDITTLLQNAEVFQEVIDQFTQYFEDKNIHKVVGIESRGFIFAAPLALRLNAGLVLVRKPGKLPSQTLNEEYALEYGSDAVEIHTDAINPGENILIIDDLLATGGTAKATGALVNKLKGNIIGYAFLMELMELKGRNVVNDPSIFSLITL
ncbi:MAG: adenine phosphoribosyltransferase [Candidatus Marinimicrobia bacterium]|jgi:adenine phosphoribosyltransferase|nr:adenine phosphoribosyltransferase [Candidatus Neomarinimicrobiota bacterium]